MTASPDTPETIRDWGRFADSSPLYSVLVEAIASDPEIIGVLNQIENRPRLNIMLAAVQYLLELDPAAPLRRFYPSLTPDPEPPSGSGPLLRQYTLENRNAILGLGATRYTQTNECRRCVALAPAVMSAVDEPFHLIDIGTSAGLNLALDRYSYNWSGVVWGRGPGPHLATESRGSPPVLRDMDVLTRTGVDLNPLDPTDEDSRRWLLALVWPDQGDRRRRLEAALDLVAGLDLRLVAGDAVEALGAVLDGFPVGEPAVVMNSFVFPQFDDEHIVALERVVSDARRSRPVHRISFESGAAGHLGSDVRVDSGDGWEVFGLAHHHGEWVEF